MEAILNQKKEIVKYFLSKDILLNPNQLAQLREPKIVEDIMNKIKENEKIRVEKEEN